MPRRESRETTLLRPAEAKPGELSWVLEIDGRELGLWLRTDLEIVPSTDGAVPAAVVAAMSQRRPLRISDPVDDLLLSNVDRVQDFFASERASWVVYHRSPQRVELEASPRPPAPADPTGAVGAFFSGGIDSFQLALDAADVTHLIRIIGIDLEQGRPELEERMARAAASLGKTLVTVRTNIRSLLFQYSSWEGSYGAALATVAVALAPAFDRIYIAAGPPDASDRPDGSDRRLDHLWSTSSLEVRRFGGELTRSEKLLRLDRSEVARSAVRVCVDETGAADNCGRCYKCLRVMLLLEALGIRERFPTFPPALDLGAVAATEVPVVYVDDYVTPELERSMREHPSAALRQALSRFAFADWAMRRRGVEERARRPRPARVLALVGSSEPGGGAGSLLLAVLEAMRRQDERTHTHLVVASGSGAAEPPGGVTEASRLDELGRARLEEVAAESDLILCADWEAALPGPPGKRVCLAAEPPSEPTGSYGRLLVTSPRLAATCANLGWDAAALRTIAAAPARLPPTPAHARDLAREKSARSHSPESPAQVAWSPRAAEWGRRVVGATSASGHQARSLSVGPSGPGASGGGGLERADVVLADPRDVVSIADAMAFGCVVVTLESSASDLVVDGVTGFLVDPRLDPPSRVPRAAELVARVIEGAAGLRELRAAAVARAGGRAPYPIARELLDSLEPATGKAGAARRTPEGAIR